MGNNELQSSLKEIKIAFRKLKAHVFFDKTALLLRDALVEFEASQDFENQLKKIAIAYNNRKLGDDSSLMIEILSSISVSPFPKSMEYPKQTDKNVISVGNPKEKPIVKKVQHFINMDVKGHILGILWIMKFGKRLDEMSIKNSRGNRLRKNLIWDENDNIIDSPALFEPYFAQYSSWRDEGLSCAEELLKKGHDSLIVMLDLKSFYYQTGITQKAFDSILDDDEDNAKCLHTSIFAVLKHYTKILRAQSDECLSCVLPIGFLPSAVLSNWCLIKFDKGILDYWNPSYYGRYVDDIIIIEKVEKGSEIQKLMEDAKGAKLSNDEIINYYLGNERRKVSTWFARKSNISCDEPLSYNNIALSDENNDVKPPDDCEKQNALYRVNSEYCLSEHSQYEFAAEKIRTLALFADNNSTALISKFKKEIYENVSMFKLLPTIGDEFSDDNFNQFYRLDNDATINKLRGVKQIAIDKYEMSKFLGKYRVVSGLVTDGETRKFTRIIGKMYSQCELIDNYILWERILEIFITDKDYTGLAEFVNKVVKAMQNIEVGDDFNACTETVQDSLIRHLTSSLNRALSLIWGSEQSKIKGKIGKQNISISLCKKYLACFMSNKHVMSIPLELACDVHDQIDVNFTDFSEALKYLEKQKTHSNFEYKYLPYFLQSHDVAMTMFLEHIHSRNSNGESSIEKYVDCIKSNSGDGDLPIEFSSSSKGGCSHEQISVGKDSSGKIHIAVANVNVSNVWNLENALRRRKPNRKYTRYLKLVELVNEAIVMKADMLVLPENYVPFEWLSVLAPKAAREGLAIITGIEHMIIDKEVYNYTAIILPFKYYDAIPTSAVFFQLKKHYAPEEKSLIYGHGFQAIENTEKRPLYIWKDVYFPVYCCYDLTDINDRTEFKSWADMIVAVEHNKDTNYFGSILESMTRDLHCYCVQVNTSEYGDSRITQPKRTEERDMLIVKGGKNQALLLEEIDIHALREFQIKDYSLQKKGRFKPTPPGIDREVIRDKIKRSQDGKFG